MQGRSTDLCAKVNSPADPPSDVGDQKQVVLQNKMHRQERKSVASRLGFKALGRGTKHG